MEPFSNAESHIKHQIIVIKVIMVVIEKENKQNKCIQQNFKE